MLPRQSLRALRRAQLTRRTFNAASRRAESTDAASHASHQDDVTVDAESFNELTSVQPQTRTRVSSRPLPRKRRVIFSGIQPTGIPHLGNYLGALRQWVKLQDESTGKDRPIFCIVDLHAVTVPYEPAQLMQWSKEMYAALLAVGLSPKKSKIYAQQDVPEHTQLMWLLSCRASMGYLGRMTQWKSKLALAHDASPFDPSPSNKPALKLGLFSYPVLQAADVLLHRATHVPVGEDQAQHIEFARELAKTLNHEFFNKDRSLLPFPGFPLPETILSPAKRIMSLTNPTKKMSKSDKDPKSRILITDTREEIHSKIKAAVTDSINGISYDPKLRPGVSNLIDIMYCMDESRFVSPEQIANDMLGQDLSMKALKEQVADTVDKGLAEVRERYYEQLARPRTEVLAEMAYTAHVVRRSAADTLAKTKIAMGLQEHHKRLA